MTFAKLPLLRLFRSRAAWLTVAGWAALALLSAWRERAHAATHGADKALLIYASIAVPLLVYGLVAATLGDRGLVASGSPLVRLGAPPARVAFATVVVAMLASALACGALGASVVALAHGPLDPPRTADALATLGFGALAGAAYAAYFTVGAAFLAGTWGRASLLVLDWILGESDGFGALLTPRAHLRNLLGGEAPFEALAWQSLASLAVIAVLAATWAVMRAARTRA